MEYKVMIDEFEGPMDLLLHLIKKSDIDIFDIQIEEIANQYLDYLRAMQEMDLNIASEYLTMAAELIELKSGMLLPKPETGDDLYEEDPRENLIQRLLDYQKYKDVTSQFRNLEEERKQYYTKEVSDLREYISDDENLHIGDVSLEDLTNALKRFLERKVLDKPLHTKITKKEYSVTTRSQEIRSILKRKKKVDFQELFDIYSKEYVVVTFLSILDLARKQELKIIQQDNFEQIYLVSEEGD